MTNPCTHGQGKASLLAHVTLASSLCLGPSALESLANPPLDGTPRSPAIPAMLASQVHERTLPQPADPLFPGEHRDLSQHVTPLAPQLVSPLLAARLIEQGRMSTSALGMVFDEKHLIFVSWDARGLVFDKALFRAPSCSHSAAVALRSQIEAQTDTDGSIRHVLTQHVSVISFLPDSVRAISEKVRIFPSAFEDSRGVSGRNWQRLDLLFMPNSFLPGAPITVSASHLVPINDALYRAFVHRAHDLDMAATRYFVLGSMHRNERVENCIGALKGVALYLPQPINEPALPRTFSLHGEQATNFIADFILRRGGVAPNSAGRFARPQDDFLMGSFIQSAPAAAMRDIAWYSLKVTR